MRAGSMPFYVLPCRQWPGWQDGAQCAPPSFHLVTRMAFTVRIWDLPTRLFHWTLALSTVGLVLTAKVGGNAMVWHFRLGHWMLALLLFRLLWGVLGGRWSRFASFVYRPTRLWHYLAGRPHPQDEVGHSPLGALSVFALLGVLLVQVTTGLLSDDEIAFAGPLTRFVDSSCVEWATSHHKTWGQYLLLGLIGAHVLAVAFYVLVRQRRLIRPMLSGDKWLERSTPPSRDDALTRGVALVLWGLCLGAAWWVSGL